MNKIFLSIVSVCSGVIIGLLSNKISGSPTISWVLISITATIYSGYLLYTVYREIPLIRGVKIISNNRSTYCQEAASLLEGSRKFLFIKSFTGFDLFTHEIVKGVVRNIASDTIEEINIIFTDLNSKAYANELNQRYTIDYLINLHKIAYDSLQSNLKVKHNVYYLDEDRCLIMMIMNELAAYIYFRGFTTLNAADGLLIFKIDLTNTIPLLSNLLLYLKDYFINKAKLQQNRGKQCH
jgi:hypothetical protein